MNTFLSAFVFAFLLALSLATNAGGVKEPTPETLAKGKAVFEKNCVICHGDKGAGDGVAGLALNPHPRNFKTDPFKNGTTPEDVFNTVTNGLKGTAMAGFAGLPEAERRAVAYYVLTLRGGK